MSAVLSSCGTYRYALWRDIPDPAQRPLDEADSPYIFDADETCLFVMLNPSTADEVEDDPTIRRCIGFARREGFGKIAVANLYALRSPHPQTIGEVDDPVGPDNDGWIATLANEASMSVAAWGASPYAAPERVREVVYMLDHDTGLACLGQTKGGHPRHPLYVPGDEPLVAWEYPEVTG